MKTFCVFVSLCLAGVLAEVTDPTYCDHHLQCPKAECCNWDFIAISYGHKGFCESYIQVGEKCVFLSTYGCGCYPGLECLPKNVSTENFDYKAERICKNTSKPYVEPHSEADCVKDSDCPAKDECCVKDPYGLGILDDNKFGNCGKLKKEGEICFLNPSDFFHCGCAPGFDCIFPETDPADGATPQRVCRKKSTN